jgi:hypothetical protein
MRVCSAKSTRFLFPCMFDIGMDDLLSDSMTPWLLQIKATSHKHMHFKRYSVEFQFTFKEQDSIHYGLEYSLIRRTVPDHATTPST